MGRGSSKAGGGGGQIMSYSAFMKLDDEQKDNILAYAVENTVVPDGVKDTPTMRVMVALGMNNKPTMVDDAALDGMQGADLYRTIKNERVYTNGKRTDGLTSDQILDQFEHGQYTSLSDTGGSSEGRGYYFATDLWGATDWATSGGKVDPSNRTIRAKADPKAKTMDIDQLFYGNRNAPGIARDYYGDSHFHDAMRRNNSTRTQPWDAISIWGIKKGYKAATATDSGTGAKELVVFDRGILKISKTVKTVSKGYVAKWHGGNGYASWGDMKTVK